MNVASAPLGPTGAPHIARCGDVTGTVKYYINSQEGLNGSGLHGEASQNHNLTPSSRHLASLGGLALGSHDLGTA